MDRAVDTDGCRTPLLDGQMGIFKLKLANNRKHFRSLFDNFRDLDCGELEN